MRESGSPTTWLYRIAWRLAAIAALRPFHRTEYTDPSSLMTTRGSAWTGKQSSSLCSSRQSTPNRIRRNRFASSAVSRTASVVREPRFSMSTCHAESAVRRTANAVSGFHHPRVASPGRSGLGNFLPVAFFYDRGSAGFSVDYGSRRVSLLKLTDVHFDRGLVQVAKAVDDVLTAARLRIPDKFLAAHGWPAEQPPTRPHKEGDAR